MRRMTIRRCLGYESAFAKWMTVKQKSKKIIEEGVARKENLFLFTSLMPIGKPITLI